MVWIYSFIELQSEHPFDWVRQLNEAGATGWELCFVRLHNGKQFAWLKKAIEPDPLVAIMQIGGDI